ncbi:hypothetical protein FRX31_025537, partial [Thalictrum thalictroides]
QQQQLLHSRALPALISPWPCLDAHPQQKQKSIYYCQRTTQQHPFPVSCHGQGPKKSYSIV